MTKGSSKLKPIIILSALAIIIFGVIAGGLAITKNFGKSNKVVTSENAIAAMNKVYKKITVNKVTPRKEAISVISTSIEDTLPKIDKYPPSVEKSTDSFIEIFSSIEKTGEKKDGWLNEVAKDFNSSNTQVNGKPVSVRIRGIASGTGMDYINSGKYIPDAFTPSNELWGEIMKSKGVKINLKDNRIVGNVTGLLLSKKKYDELSKKYGAINLKTIVDATISNEIEMGYTNPLASSTGLNFLVSTLSTFDLKNPLSDAAISKFESFQANIPFVAYTTLQMRESAQSGILEGFIMEYQTYNNSPELKSNYIFTPFGFRHDSPMYELGNLSAEKQEILTKFIALCKSDKNQKLASDYGFNQLNDYKAEIASVSGDKITQSLKLWKEKKNVTKNISAVFVADTSGSMQGQSLNKLKDSLLKGMQFISKDSSIGLVTYSDDVNINLPIGEFNLNQKSLFTGAVKDMQAGGGTATFDAITVAAKMLMDEKAKDPNAKLMLFVLSDGETNKGNSLNDIKGFLQVFKIPVYTIGYNADIKALQSISSINEAASINADSEDVIYKISNLFNAEM
jgi:Ca-activated chloride channel family protein